LTPLRDKYKEGVGNQLAVNVLVHSGCIFLQDCALLFSVLCFLTVTTAVLLYI